MKTTHLLIFTDSKLLNIRKMDYNEREQYINISRSQVPGAESVPA